MEKYAYGTLPVPSDGIGVHPDFVHVPTAGTFGRNSDLIDAENRVIWEGLQVQEEMANYSAETRAMLDDICNSVAAIVDDISGDFGDYAADLEEMI